MFKEICKVTVIMFVYLTTAVFMTYISFTKKKKVKVLCLVVHKKALET